MNVILIANQKGGVAKTTTCTALAWNLEKKKYRTLLIDADPQGNSTDTYRAAVEGVATLYDVLLDNDRIPLVQAIQKTACGDIVAADPLLKEADQVLYTTKNGLYRMQEAINELAAMTDKQGKPLYDIVIIDTGPTINSMMESCMVAADYMIIPVTGDRYPLKGLADLTASIQMVQSKYNRNLKVAGLLLTRYDSRLRQNQTAEQDIDGITNALNTRFFKTRIRESVRCREAQGARMSLYEFSPYCTPARDYKRFTEEFTKEVLKNGKE